MNHVTERHMAIVNYRDIEGLSFTAIGKILSMRRQNARDMYYRVKKWITAEMNTVYKISAGPSTHEQRLAARRKGRGDRMMGVPMSAGYGDTIGEALSWEDGWKDADEYLAKPNDRKI